MREARAEKELDALFAEQIEPFFRSIGATSEQVQVDAFSQEQDELHQFVDCIMMGPYGAADLHARFETATNADFVVPQYHRDAPGSRAFATGIQTGGSPLRRSVMAAVQTKASEYALQGVLTTAHETMQAVRSTFHDTANMRYVLCSFACAVLFACARELTDVRTRSCQCPASEARSIACCFEHNWASPADITFPANGALDRTWKMHSNVLGEIMSDIVENQLLSRDVWTEKEFSFAPPLPAGERYELRRMYLFDPESTVMEYSEAEVISSAACVCAGLQAACMRACAYARAAI